MTSAQLPSLHHWTAATFVDEARLLQSLTAGQVRWRAKKRRLLAMPTGEDANGIEEGYLESGPFFLKPPQTHSAATNSNSKSDREQVITSVDLADATVEDDGELPSSISSSPPLHRYNYHICYSSSFRVPVMFLDACTLDGTPLPIREVIANLRHAVDMEAIEKVQAQHENGVDAADVDMEAPSWQVITQMHHPILNRPMYALHPCQTATWMAHVMQSVATQQSTTTTAADNDDGEVAYLDAELDAIAQENTCTPSSSASCFQSGSNSNATESLLPPTQRGLSINPSYSSLTSSNPSPLPLLTWLSIVAPVVAMPFHMTDAIRALLGTSNNNGAALLDHPSGDSK